jgi:NAD(P)-dependent dehydrogenase (short-subunit alcohol dehydrogenase family)
MITLKDKIALVTGGGAGIGRAIADAYGELGATVVVAEIDKGHCDTVRKRLSDAGVPNLVLQIDARDAAQVKGLMGEIERRYGRLDILVNNVGHSLNLYKTFADSKPEDWDALHAVNFRHILVVTHAALPLLKRSAPGSSIISLSSIEGLRGYPIGVVYAAYKSAVIGFTKSLACELGGDGIRVNSIAPETTETEQVQIVASVKPEYQDHVKRWFPLGRYGRPEDSAGAAVYLATDLSAWTTGETILVDGGALAQGGWRQARDGRWTNSPIIDATHRSYGPPRTS